jgi:hypothetical protein
MALLRASEEQGGFGLTWEEMLRLWALFVQRCD